eukprot:2986520-Prymnesium_polylepis.1
MKGNRTSAKSEEFAHVFRNVARLDDEHARVHHNQSLLDHVHEKAIIWPACKTYMALSHSSTTTPPRLCFGRLYIWSTSHSPSDRSGQDLKRKEGDAEKKEHTGHEQAPILPVSARAIR